MDGAEDCSLSECEQTKPFDNIISESRKPIAVAINENRQTLLIFARNWQMATTAESTVDCVI